MNGLPYYKAYPRDFFEGTRGMSGELKGAYRMVLDMIYQHGGRLHDDPRHIAGELGYSVRKWNSLLSKLVEIGKLRLNDGIISNFRADKELVQLALMQDKQRENRSRPNKINDITNTMVSPKPHHTEPDTEERETSSLSMPRKRATPKTRIPPDAIISERMRAAAEQRGLSDAEAEAQFAKFRDWALAKGQAYADWDAAWRNWLTSPHFAPVLGAVHPFPSNRRKTHGERYSELSAEAEARLAEQPF